MEQLRAVQRRQASRARHQQHSSDQKASGWRVTGIMVQAATAPLPKKYLP